MKIDTGNFAIAAIAVCTIILCSMNAWSQDWLPKVNRLPPQFQQGRVLHYDFAEGEGDVVRDKSGKGRNAKIHGAKWVDNDQDPMARLTGKKDGALEFDGWDDYVDCGNSNYLRPDEFTISAWLSPRKVAGGENLLTCFINGRNGYYSGYRLLFTEAGSRFSLQWGDGEKLNGILSARVDKLGEEVWQHVVVTFGERTMKLYLNGELEGEKEWARFSFRKRNPHLWIGRAGGGVDPYRGKIKSFRMYSRVLSEEEIEKLYELAQ